MNNDIEKELKELQIQYDKVLKDRNKLKKENEKLKEIIKANFNYFKDTKNVFFIYNLPVMEEEILEVLKDEQS